MEILSTGEKIKRARIYKGLTLKELCEDKISVSKMSCIENDKVKAEEWVLNFIAEKLEIDSKYLKQDIKTQVMENIEKIQKYKNSKEYEEKLEYNLKFIERYSYFDLSFQVVHLLFNYYLENDKIEKIQLIIYRYYDYLQKCFSEERVVLYYMDMAKFFYITEEFIQASKHYNNVEEISKKSGNFKLLSNAIYNEASCYIKLKDYRKAYDIAIELIDLMNYIDSDIKKAEAYQMLAVLCLRNNIKGFEEYEAKSYELYKEELVYRSQAIFNYAVVMFDIGLKDKAVEYISNGLKCYPRDNKELLVDFMLMNISELIENNVLDKAQDICDEILNHSINLDNIIFIEKAYYYKALISEKLGNLYSAETYMNLSLDALLKFANNRQIYKRYMKMGDMYYRMGNAVEAIKYFNCAIQLEKKI